MIVIGRRWTPKKVAENFVFAFTSTKRALLKTTSSSYELNNVEIVMHARFEKQSLGMKDVAKSGFAHPSYLYIYIMHIEKKLQTVDMVRYAISMITLLDICGICSC